MSSGRSRVAFIIQRYGDQITGGSETHCRQVVQRLSAWYEIDVLTTTARDHLSWKNHFAPGEESADGVRILRFPVVEERNLTGFHSIYDQIFHTQLSRDQERVMVHYQGPVSPELDRYISQNRERYDAFVFFTYLYRPTVNGLTEIGDRALFVPTLHDEPSLYIHLLDDIFHATPHLLFNTEEERHLARRRFNLPSSWGRIAGIGLEEPTPGDTADASWPGLRERLGKRKILSYTGRVENGKGCDELVEYFLRFVEQERRGDVVLLLMGRRTMPLAPHPQVIASGYVSEYVKYHALQASTASVAPSPHESLCLAALESWMHGKPVLANGRSPVLAGHCVRGNGGLWYNSWPEFRETLRMLLDDDELAHTLGQQGRAYVQSTYQWPFVVETWRDELEKVIAKSRKAEAAGRFIREKT